MLVNMKTLLTIANQNNFAIPAFNTPTGVMLRGIIEASEAAQAPVIIEVHPAELSFARSSFITQIVEEAHKASVPICIHLDHGSSMDQVVRAIQCGYTSVMIDASSKSFDENVAICKEVCKIAHAVNVSVEAEIGTIGVTNQDQVSTSSTEIRYTQPEEAVRFVEESGVDALAIAIGTCHGIYPKGMIPKLQLELLKKIKAAIPIPLVLHGGSANHDEEIAEAARNGINKINISSDIKDAFYQKCREVLQDPYIREPGDIYIPCIDAMKQVIFHKFDLLGTTGKASLYSAGMRNNREENITGPVI